MAGLNSFTVDYLYSKLSGKFYFVKVPITATYSETEIRLLGTATELTGEGNLNPNQATFEFIKVRLPLTRILEIYTTGFRVYVPDEKDAKKIADDLDELLVKSSRGHGIDTTGITDLCTSFLKDILLINNKGVEKELNREMDRIKDEHFGTGLFLTTAGGPKIPGTKSSKVDNIKVEFKNE